MQYQVLFDTVPDGVLQQHYFAAHSDSEARLRGFVTAREAGAIWAVVEPLDWHHPGGSWVVVPHHP
jgi:hypothetical protein